ncbi:MAG TPA: hypothetical protein P5137_12705 [Candidatus Brocadiia bacterium]|nr:hypothetical protein [Candidatus Brocadiia bacterium]
MPGESVGPAIVIAINLALAVWAVARRPGDSSYLVFAAFGVSLALWNAGGVMRWLAGAQPEESGRLVSAWLRVSFLASLLAPANVLMLAITPVARARGLWAKPKGWAWLIYAPVLAMGALLELGFVRSGASSNSWRRTFYDTSDAGALAVVALVGAYLLAAAWLGWPDRRAPRQERRRAEVVYWGVLAPFALGVLGVLALGALRHDRAPTAALWMMIVSQTAMFQMIRLGWVELRVTRQKAVLFVLVFILASMGVLLAAMVMQWLLERRLGLETAVIMAACLVAGCYIYAAALPRLEAWSGRLARRQPRRAQDSAAAGTGGSGDGDGAAG